MIMLTTHAVALALALTTGVSAAYIPSELEPRTPAMELGKTMLNVAKTAGRTTGRRVLTPPRTHMLRPPTGPTPQAAGLSGKQVTAGMVGGKIVGGLLVGGGSLAAGRVHSAVNRRDVADELEVRNPALRGARLATQTLRTVARPAARPVARIAPAPRPVTPPPVGFGSKAKGGATIAGLALTAGAGEYFGQKHMDNAIERLNSRSLEIEDLIETLLARDLLEEDMYERDWDVEEVPLARDFDEESMERRGLEDHDDIESRDLDDELFERNPAAHGAKLAQTVLRTAAHVRPPPAIARPMTPGSSTLKTAGKVAGFGGAAFTGGWFEGMAQNVNIPTQQALAKDPKGSVQKMLPTNRVTQALGLKGRELLEDDILAIRALLLGLEDALD